MTRTNPAEAQPVAARLATLDRFLPVWILAAMALGLAAGRLVPGLGAALDTIAVRGVSLPIALGLLLWLYYGIGKGPGNGWLHAKLVLVLAVIGYHHACRALLRSFEQFANKRSERWFRVFNESAVLLFTAIVVLVVVKPF